ncbi:TPA: hypothetical protein JRX32_000339 [Elizabethkingia anophelis]|nr:hypothetical protein [Elizabethkingia anophelis]HAY3533755.1 hypothetical protein [Elizabethkingia anophelis]HAY3545871.1 hypothetical protein [Elizabethkingia anophelis]HAY3590697.1 hypothetical protein [Elizabethkingia anophelis]
MYKPILFSTPMVQAIDKDRKNQTRRIVKKKYSNTDIKLREDKYGTHLCEIQNDVPASKKNEDGSTTHHISFFEYKIPKYKIGDILWVRETWMIAPNYENGLGEKYYYKASKCDQFIKEWKGFWRPSIFMPREAARLFLEVTNVRAEKLQDISEKDAINEGILIIEHPEAYYDYELKGKCGTFSTARGSFYSLWDSINKKHTVNYNPWVWVYNFKKVDKPKNWPNVK